jgi:alkaline phosphatase D
MASVRASNTRRASTWSAPGRSPNPDLSPHLEFVDLGGHGYAKVRLSADEMRTEFVCIPRPITRSEKPDGGPLRYRVVHTAALWKSGQRAQLETPVLQGDAGLGM